MNSAQNSAIATHFELLCNQIHLDKVISVLGVKNIPKKQTLKGRNKKLDNVSKANFLFMELQSRDHAWDVLLDALRIANQSDLADLLSTTAELENLCEIIARKYIKDECETIPQVWEDFVEVTELPFANENLQIVELNDGHTTQIIIEPSDYKYLTKMNNRIFLIEGDPGIGKSTYVNKIALDWANNHPLLNETFNYVLIVSWANITKKNWKNSIIEAFGKKLNPDSLQNLFKSNKVLIILDGYDKKPRKNVLDKITANIDPITGDSISARLLITTRKSHVKDFGDIKNKTWLRILGFDKRSAASFIKVGVLEWAIFVKKGIKNYIAQIYSVQKFNTVT